jgi:hypothetical protein
MKLRPVWPGINHPRGQGMTVGAKQVQPARPLHAAPSGEYVHCTPLQHGVAVLQPWP